MARSCPPPVQGLAEERTAFSRGVSAELGRGPIARTGLCVVPRRRPDSLWVNRGQSEAYPYCAMRKAAAVVGFRMSRRMDARMPPGRRTGEILKPWRS
jgi:hypothetical protein